MYGSTTTGVLSTFFSLVLSFPARVLMHFSSIATTGGSGQPLACSQLIRIRRPSDTLWEHNFLTTWQTHPEATLLLPSLECPESHGSIPFSRLVLYIQHVSLSPNAMLMSKNCRPPFSDDSDINSSPLCASLNFFMMCAFIKKYTEKSLFCMKHIATPFS